MLLWLDAINKWSHRFDDNHRKILTPNDKKTVSMEKKWIGCELKKCTNTSAWRWGRHTIWTRWCVAHLFESEPRKTTPKIGIHNTELVRFLFGFVGCVQTPNKWIYLHIFFCSMALCLFQMRFLLKPIEQELSCKLPAIEPRTHKCIQCVTQYVYSFAYELIEWGTQKLFNLNEKLFN